MHEPVRILQSDIERTFYVAPADSRNLAVLLRSEEGGAERSMVPADGRVALLYALGSISEDRAECLLDEEEMISRAFAQYCAQASRSRAMLQSVDALEDLSKRNYQEQWDDSDFAPIAIEMRWLLRKLGVSLR